jgi:hypothetical protein
LDTIKSKNNHKMIRIIYAFLMAIIATHFPVNAYTQNKFLIIREFSTSNVPTRPNYSESRSWAALPTTKDRADDVPKSKGILFDNQSKAKADVFFIYPTIYTDKPKNEYDWNASIEDIQLNEKIDNSTIKNQASVFNGTCKIYAPRYRQAHYSVFLTKDTLSAKKAMDVAYDDIKEAFLYYIKNYNNGRPFIIAGHSQGTLHAIRLLSDFIDGEPLQAKLIGAYLVGMPVNNGMFKNIQLSTKPGSIGGYVSWNTFADGFYPDYYENGLHKSQLINPITWTLEPQFSEIAKHKGTLGRKFKISPQIVSAKPHEGLLWIKKPKVFGKVFLNTKIWHFADYNLFWMDIRENLTLQIQNLNKSHEIK